MPHVLMLQQTNHHNQNLKSDKLDLILIHERYYLEFRFQAITEFFYLNIYKFVVI